MVVVIVMFLIIPLPETLLDILIITNISVSIVILMVTMTISEALEFSIFPSLLLITTLYRIGINISSTRSIGYFSFIKNYGNGTKSTCYCLSPIVA